MFDYDSLRRLRNELALTGCPGGAMERDILALCDEVERLHEQANDADRDTTSDT